MDTMDAPVKGSLHIFDYVIFGILLAISLGIGIFHSLFGKKNKTTEEYLMGNRQMSPIPVTLSFTGENIVIMFYTI